jgi:hypothetical protein
MENIIFKNIYNKVDNTTKNINNYFDNIDYFNNGIFDILYQIPKYNLIIYIFIVFLFFRFIDSYDIKLNNIFALMIVVIFMYFVLNIKKKNNDYIKNNNNIKLKFLHKLMFDSEYSMVNSDILLIKPENSLFKSYLYKDTQIIELYYSMRNYSQFNISAYVNSLIHTNNVIGLEDDNKLKVNNSYENYQLAIDETKKAMNELNSIIYNLPSTKISYNKFKNDLQLLHKFLNSYIRSMGERLKNNNRILENITIDYTPDNFYDSYFVISPDVTKENDYISTFDMY